MLRRVTIYRSLLRRILILGCDRELILLTGLITFALVFSIKTFASIIFAGFFWSICFAFLRMMGKADPMARHVYLRRIKYNEFYPARSTPYKK